MTVLPFRFVIVSYMAIRPSFVLRYGAWMMASSDLMSAEALAARDARALTTMCHVLF